MPATVPPSDLAMHAFKSAGHFATFLSHNHGTCPGIWLKVAKKSANLPSVSYDEATDVALCYGWINGQRKPFDEQWSLSRFTPRRPNSTWSKRNVDKVAMLTEAGRMHPAGIAAVDAAKADGRWERAYAGPATITVPDDFSAAIAKDATAASYFAGLNKTDRYMVLLRVHTASPQNRDKRIVALVADLAAGKVPGKPKSTVKASGTANMRLSKTKLAKTNGSTAGHEVRRSRRLRSGD